MSPIVRPPYALLLTLTAALMLATIGCSSKTETVVIAVLPTSTPEQLSSSAKDLEKFLEGRLDADVELRFPTTYAGVVESLNYGHADAAFMSAWPAALAKKHAGADVVLA